MQGKAVILISFNLNYDEKISVCFRIVGIRSDHFAPVMQQG